MGLQFLYFIAVDLSRNTAPPPARSHAVLLPVLVRLPVQLWLRRVPVLVLLCVPVLVLPLVLRLPVLLLRSVGLTPPCCGKRRGPTPAWRAYPLRCGTA